MKLFKQCLVIVLGLLCIHVSKGQNANLSIIDPQIGWSSYQGTIEEATVTTRPVGVYTEIGLYMTVSAQGAGFQLGRQLEAVMNFSLPKNAIVNDSWLWIDSTIIRAKILDRWTASSIYESIVSRRRDPSILTKEYGDRYTLRIYPLIMGKSRKVKLSYLVPGEWSAQNVITQLPADLLRSTQGSTPPIDIRVFLETSWQEPKLPSHPEVVFTLNDDPKLGKFYAARIPSGGLDGRNLSFGVKAPLKNGLFLSRYGDNQQGYYQMVLFPDQLLDFTQNIKPRRMMVLVHYNPTAVSPDFTLDKLLELISSQLKRTLRPQDFFNVIVAGISPKPISENWLPAKASEIDQVFNSLKTTNISSFNLPGLLGKGIETIKKSGLDAKVLLFSNSGAEGDLSTSNQLIRELSAIKGDAVIPFYVVDFATQGVPYYYFNNRNFYGNEYFYLNWSRLTQGEFQQVRQCCNFIDQVASTVIDLAAVEKATLDLHTALQNGFCFNRYNLNQTGELNDLRKPIIQVGRYQGKWPFVVELSGSYNNTLFLDGITVPLTDVSTIDSTGADAWSGNYIAALEKNNSNSNTVEIINTSIRERILSIYTAFLCLEPAQGGEPCVTCNDQSKGQPTVGTRDLQDSLIISKISPNPFRDQVMIQLKFKELIDLSAAKVVVYNHLGQIVRTFSDVPKGKVQDLELHWDGRSDAGASVPNGVYIFHMQTPNGQISRKLLKMAN
jgi:Ca-activated chloride channel family protein